MMEEHKLSTGSNKKILIIKPSSLGDIVHSLPILDILFGCFPGIEIHWLVAKGFESILEGHPMLKRVWIIHKDEWKRITNLQTTIIEVRRLFRNLKAERFDYVIDLQGLFRSGLIAKATGAPVRVGFKEAREGSTVFYTHTVVGGKRKDVHAVDRYLKVAAFLGCDVSEVKFTFPPNSNPLVHKTPVYGDYAVMAPGARGSAKRWPARRFGKLASMLPLKSMVIGSRADRMLADEVVKTSRGNAISIAGTTDLKGLIEVIKGAKFMVSNDTGSMHIAAALGIPVFALFGPTNPMSTGPYGSGHTVIRKDIPCSPCYKKTCDNVKCMDMIKAEEVAVLITDFLAS